MKNRNPRLIVLSLFIAILLLSSFPASAVVIELITGSAFEGRVAGPIGDIYWEGGANDSDLTDFFSPGFTGLNTVGSSSNFLAFDNFTNFNFFNNSFVTGNTVYGAPLVFGNNNVLSVSRETETTGFGDGPTGLPPSVVGTNVVTVNRNNTYSYTNFITEDTDYTYDSTVINAYSLLQGQNPNDIFMNLDPSAFTNPFGFQDIEVNRLIDNFEFIMNEVAPGWTALNYELFFTFATAKDPNANINFVGNGSYNYVSFDEGAIPQEVTSVPEPSTYMLLGIGMLGLIGFSRKNVRVS